MVTINYEKYSNMDRRQLLNSLLNAEKKEQKIRDKFKDDLNAQTELIKFLKSKIKESIDKPKYYTLETSPAMKKFRKWRDENPEQAEQIAQELEEEMKSYADHNPAQS